MGDFAAGGGGGRESTIYAVRFHMYTTTYGWRLALVPDTPAAVLVVVTVMPVEAVLVDTDCGYGTD